MVIPGHSLGDRADQIHTVPYSDTPGCCRVCFGTANTGFDRCYKCQWIWGASNAFQSVELIVPCSVAPDTSPWYRAMRTYKETQFKEHAPTMARLLHQWMRQHLARVAEALGGDPSVMIAVPSKRRPPPTPLQTITEAVAARLGIPAPSSLRYQASTGAAPANRDTMIAENFKVMPSVKGQRVVLVEDTWVGGQTAVGAAVALKDAGVAALAIIPISRMTYTDGMTPDYVAGATTPVDLARWPVR